MSVRTMILSKIFKKNHGPSEDLKHVVVFAFLLSAGDIFCQLSNTDLNFSTRVAVNETETRPNQTNRNAKNPPKPFETKPMKTKQNLPMCNKL